jgi:hypothetical protein
MARDTQVLEGRAVIVHSLADAEAALTAAASLGVPVVLLSPPGAAAYMGAGYFRALVERALATQPGVAATAVLDCGDAAGHAMGALREGLKALLFKGADEVAARLADIAGRSGAVLLREPPPALDLAGERDPLAACRRWLAG